MKYWRIFLPLILFYLSGCTPTAVRKTPLEIQTIQTREYQTTQNIAFPSVISVLQDLGYIITHADKETGLITAESAATSNSSFMSAFSGISAHSQTKVTAFIETIKKVTKVRLNFLVTHQQSSHTGQIRRHDKAILNPKVYQNAFERIESAIFLRSSQ